VTIVLRGVVLATLVAAAGSGRESEPTPPTTFGNDAVRVNRPGMDAAHLPSGPATVCLVSSDKERCYEPPKRDPPFGVDPQTRTIRLAAGHEALLFTVISTAWGSGYRQLLALLRPGPDSRLENLLSPEVVVSELSEYEFWDEPSISEFALLVVAEAIWGEDGCCEGETHFSSHRFRVTSYTFDRSSRRYGVCDRYVTARKYPSEPIAVLEPEKGKILARLRRCVGHPAHVGESDPERTHAAATPCSAKRVARDLLGRRGVR
jgi:hypothetical protein